jgi:hypothetical protein
MIQAVRKITPKIGGGRDEPALYSERRSRATTPQFIGFSKSLKSATCRERWHDQYVPVSFDNDCILWAPCERGGGRKAPEDHCQSWTRKCNDTTVEHRVGHENSLILHVQYSKDSPESAGTVGSAGEGVKLNETLQLVQAADHLFRREFSGSVEHLKCISIPV